MIYPISQILIFTLLAVDHARETISDGLATQDDFPLTVPQVTLSSLTAAVGQIIVCTYSRFSSI